MIIHIEHFESFGENYNTNRSIPLWYYNTMEALLSIRCYMCIGLLSDNFEPIIIRKTGRKIFRVETRCSECKRIKSKKFCDTFNKLQHEMYQLVLNTIYIDYTPSGINFTELSKSLKEYRSLSGLFEVLVYKNNP